MRSEFARLSFASVISLSVLAAPICARAQQTNTVTASAEYDITSDDYLIQVDTNFEAIASDLQLDTVDNSKHFDKTTSGNDVRVEPIGPTTSGPNHFRVHINRSYFPDNATSGVILKVKPSPGTGDAVAAAPIYIDGKMAKELKELSAENDQLQIGLKVAAAHTAHRGAVAVDSARAYPLDKSILLYLNMRGSDVTNVDIKAYSVKNDGSRGELASQVKKLVLPGQNGPVTIPSLTENTKYLISITESDTRAVLGRDPFPEYDVKNSGTDLSVPLITTVKRSEPQFDRGSYTPAFNATNDQITLTATAFNVDTLKWRLVTVAPNNPQTETPVGKDDAEQETSIEIKSGSVGTAVLKLDKPVEQGKSYVVVGRAFLRTHVNDGQVQKDLDNAVTSSEVRRSAAFSPNKEFSVDSVSVQFDSDGILFKAATSVPSTMSVDLSKLGVSLDPTVVAKYVTPAAAAAASTASAAKPSTTPSFKVPNGLLLAVMQLVNPPSSDKTPVTTVPSVLKDGIPFNITFHREGFDQVLPPYQVNLAITTPTDPTANKDVTGAATKLVAAQQSGKTPDSSVTLKSVAQTGFSSLLHLFANFLPSAVTAILTKIK